MLNRIIITIIALAGIAGVIYWLSASASNGEEIPSELIAKAEVRDIEYELQISGEITPILEVEIKPEVGGRVKKLHGHGPLRK